MKCDRKSQLFNTITSVYINYMKRILKYVQNEQLTINCQKVTNTFMVMYSDCIHMTK